MRSSKEPERGSYNLSGRPVRFPYPAYKTEKSSSDKEAIIIGTDKTLIIVNEK
jgi:hypothetical protein